MAGYTTDRSLHVKALLDGLEDQAKESSASGILVPNSSLCQWLEIDKSKVHQISFQFKFHSLSLSPDGVIPAASLGITVSVQHRKGKLMCVL